MDRIIDGRGGRDLSNCLHCREGERRQIFAGGGNVRLEWVMVGNMGWNGLALKGALAGRVTSRALH